MRWGTSYYPELVPESEWARDLDLMRTAGLECIRMLDFAWTALEPREGELDFAWLDRFIAQAQARGIGLVLCTPTASPPPWLARAFPEILIENKDGTVRPLGSRRDGDVDSPIYRDYCCGIARALAARYGRHPAVIGWQIDNELLGPEGVSPESHTRANQWRFRQWLKARHGSVGRLNERWGLRFWNQEYGDWGEVETPRHPRIVLGHWLDHQEYFSASQRDFVQVQADAMRPHLDPRQWLSTNGTAIFDRGLDHLVYAEACEMVGWDAYAGAAAGSAGCYRHEFTAAAHDLFRAAKQKPFWVFEINCLDGAVTEAAVAEAALRGAEAIVFWHWRPHRANVESGGVAICDLAGRPIEERIARLQRLRALPLPAMPARCVPAPAAIVFDPENQRAEMCPNPYRRALPPVRYLHAFGAMYAALRRLGVPVDVRRSRDDLSAYRLIAVPSPEFLGEEAAARLVERVRAGATFLGCAKSAHRDQWGRCYAEPGAPLAALTGGPARADERSSEPLRVRFADGELVECMPWAERLPAAGCEVLARFQGGAFDGAAALTRRDQGRGRSFYLATLGDRAIERAARSAAEAAGLSTVAGPHADVGVLPDPGGAGTWYFNHGAEERCVDGVAIPAGGCRRA